MLSVSDGISPEHIMRCEKLIRPQIRRTPVIEIDGADVGVDSIKLCLKLELFQHCGSFKARGAFANLLTPPGGRAPYGYTANTANNCAIYDAQGPHS